MSRKNIKWAIKYRWGEYALVRDTRRECIEANIFWETDPEKRRGKWKWFRDVFGERCVKVRIVEVGRYEERHYTEDDEFVDSAPVDGVHIERMSNGTVWLRIGNTLMNFIARKNGVLEWQVDEIGDDVEVEK